MIKTHPKMLATLAAFKTRIGVRFSSHIQSKLYALIWAIYKPTIPINKSVISDVIYVSLLIRYLDENSKARCVLFWNWNKKRTS
jgi:hypothetical protein